jgi:hypothetical protein
MGILPTRLELLHICMSIYIGVDRICCTKLAYCVLWAAVYQHCIGDTQLEEHKRKGTLGLLDGSSVPIHMR